MIHVRRQHQSVIAVHLLSIVRLTPRFDVTRTQEAPIARLSLLDLERLIASGTASVREYMSRKHLWRDRIDPGQERRDFGSQVIYQLREVSRLLSVIYSSCVTAEFALEGQNADRDRDILTALRMHVSEPVSRQVERLDLLVSELGGAPGTPQSSEDLAGAGAHQRGHPPGRRPFSCKRLHTGKARALGNIIPTHYTIAI
jgi:hypothetical protein